MKSLKFSSNDSGAVFYRELNEQVNAFFEKTGKSRFADWKMWVKIGGYFLAVAASYFLLLTSKSVAGFYFFYLLTGFFVLLTAFNVSHDAAHGVIAKSKKLNDWLFSLSFHLQGNNGYVWRKYHNESHHAYTNVEGSDIDVLNNPAVRMTQNQKLEKWHRFQHIYAPFLYLLYSLNWFFIRETLMIFGKSSRTIHFRIPPAEVIRLVFYKIFYLGYMIFIPIFFLEIGWGNVLLAFFLNHFLVSVIFTGVLGVSHLSDQVEHPEPDANGSLSMSWANLQLKTSVDYNPDSRFLNWTLGGFNAHTLHHLLPNICHTHYLDLLPILRKTAEKHGLIYNEMPYPKALASHFRFLYKMGRA